ncbi:MAG: hypothetical protein CME13_23425 [Gemmatimonadetes bacterium]|nr:hypothetical protein [Gemmatimonadota bacterium]HCV23852.1 hypothetical protein [Candidatus Latescibacterota bacterium]
MSSPRREWSDEIDHGCRQGGLAYVLGLLRDRWTMTPKGQTKTATPSGAAVLRGPSSDDPTKI